MKEEAIQKYPNVHQLYKQRAADGLGERHTSLHLVAAAEALRHKAATAGDLLGDLWCAFIQAFHASTDALPIAKRRSFRYNLGEELGHVTLLEAATKGLNLCEASGYLFVFVVCRDFAHEIAKKTCVATLKDKECTPFDICCYYIEHFGGTCFAPIVLIRLVYILALTGTLQKERTYNFYDSASIGDISEAGIFAAALGSVKHTAEDWTCLAISWRDLSYTAQHRITTKKKVSQCKMWGLAIGLCHREYEIGRVADAMRPDEFATMMSGGEMLDRTDVRRLREKMKVSGKKGK